MYINIFLIFVLKDICHEYNIETKNKGQGENYAND